jgi:hypothetical protein
MRMTNALIGVIFSRYVRVKFNLSLQIVATKMLGWLEAQIQNARRVRLDEIDHGKRLKEIEMQEKMMKEMEESGMQQSRKFDP